MLMYTLAINLWKCSVNICEDYLWFLDQTKMKNEHSLSQYYEMGVKANSVLKLQWSVDQHAPGKPYKEPNITVNGHKPKVVDKFPYLGSTLSKAVYIDDEITATVPTLRRETFKIIKTKMSQDVGLRKLLIKCQDNRHRDREEDRNARHAYSL